MTREPPVAPLLIATPTDGVATLLARAAQQGVPRVQLLLPDKVTLLRSTTEALQLASGARALGLDLLLISADALTLAAARQAGLPTVAVVNAQVTLPSAPAQIVASPAVDSEHNVLNTLDDLEVTPFDTVENELTAAQASLEAALNPGATPVGTVGGTPRRPSPATVPARGRRRRLMVALTAIPLLILLSIIAALLLLSSRVTVTVTAPLHPELVEPVAALPLPLTTLGSNTTTAVAAEVVGEQVAFSVQGEVVEETERPSSSARGTVTIFNSTPQEVQLPRGTEFVALQSGGQEVAFLSLTDMIIPASTTIDTGAQIITNRGQASVEVEARSPGSGSNVGENSVQRITPPGGVTFNVGMGGLLVQHNALDGGEDVKVRIVKDSDVAKLLASALEGLDAEARRRLEDRANNRGLTLELTTIQPNRTELEQLQGFEQVIEPGLGQEATPGFTLTVQANYSALVTAPAQPLERQLGSAFIEQLRQAGRLMPGDCRTSAVTDWRWDGTALQLFVEGQIVPDTSTPGCGGELGKELLDQVREAVRGKSRAEAEAALDAMVASGLIGSYRLPATDYLPGWDWQVEVSQGS